MSGLSIRDVSVSYGRRPVLAGLSLPDLAPGEVTVLAGPNAAGKSTLLRAIAGLAPARGQIALGGEDLARLSGQRRAALIGFMPQTLPSGASLVVLETVIAALRAGSGREETSPESRAMAVLSRLGIASLALDPLDQLSGGQRQMVSLAQAVVRDPRLLLLDEPTSALDLARQVRLLTEVRRIAAEGRVVLAVLHDLALAARWADRIAILHKGGLYSFGPPAEVVTPAMLAEVYGVSARIETCSRGHLMVQIDGEIAAPAL
ncbi:ABC transporter ATP-binding protein [Pseudogemmobacter humi]|uniref:Iron(3+)-hydroxamate import ATP-binding protein FhuC n=1 Tax=Pseudogemmobacter humi TaxID=2483812 RepID=A0A3P5XTY4_9RHOB|nr:ABC transporter ATP-binding protein [Pseudogemmobacter humi]VDC31498.1 Iron(3+)-hydroxamate import ATP-binding protein FhuC [Pseudogemmobacter humi]